MDEIDRLLNEAGGRWRASQRPPPDVDEGPFVDTRGRANFAWSMVGAATTVITAIVVVGIWTQFVSGRTGVTGPGAPVAASPGYVDRACAVTRPNPPFSAPSPYPTSPPDAGYAWFGTPELWTRLELDGEVWDATDASFPVGIKMFWWSSNWAGMREDQQPDIAVVATRLDGPGTVRSDEATNAAAESLGGEAMLAGIEFPTPGCWLITAEYREAELSYVVWIRDE